MNYSGPTGVTSLHLKTVLSGAVSLALFTFWILQVNPLSIWVMCESSGLGYGTIRSTLYLTGVVILATALLSTSEFRLGLHIKYIYYWLPIFLVFAFRVALELTLDDYDGFDFIGAFPLAEFMISLLLFLSFDVYTWLNEKINKIIIGAALFLLADIALWIYAEAAGISFGVFRANMSGVVLNRMSDLFYVGVGAYLLISRRANYFMKAIATVAIILSLYRSAYVASIGVLFYALYAYRGSYSLYSLITKSVVITIGMALLIQLFSTILDLEFDIFQAILERIQSVFLPDTAFADEVGKSSRLEQIEPLITTITENIIAGVGFGYNLLGEPIYNYFNYFLIILSIYGIGIAAAFAKPIYALLSSLAIPRGGALEGRLLVNSMIVYYFILLNIFPYVIYFPIGSVVAFCLSYQLWSKQSCEL